MAYSTLKRSRYGLGARKRLKAGKKVKAWNAVRRALKVKFEAMGITSCELRYEGCKRNDWLSFAHGKKRRKLEGDELSELVVVACQPCHQRIEILPADEMLRIVTETIERRNNGDHNH